MRKTIVGLAAALLSGASAGCGGGSEATAPPIQLVPASMLPLAGGSGQTGIVDQGVATPPAVLILDKDNRPVSGVSVTFAVVTGGGSVSGGVQATNAAGVATVGGWTLRNFGPNTLSANASGLPTITFSATGTAPDTGMLAFNVADPAGDTLPNTEGSALRAIDVLSVRGDFKRDSLIVTITFSDSVAPGALEQANSVGGIVELDIDDNASTGRPPISNFFGASAELGVDFVIDLFTATSQGAYVLSVAGQEILVPASFANNGAVVRIPMSFLGSDDGNFGWVGVVGNVDRPTDVFPNSGASLVRRASTSSAVLERLGTAVPALSSGQLSRWRTLR